MVGEIRDLETAEMAIRASLTGHLVLSTVHTNSAAATITRLLDMGVADYLLASSLKGVLAQRLVRRLCSVCAKPAQVPKAVFERLAGSAIDDRAAIGMREACGCPACRNTGFSGRTTIYELLTITPSLKDVIAGAAAERAITSEAQREGMTLDAPQRSCQSAGGRNDHRRSACASPEASNAQTMRTRHMTAQGAIGSGTIAASSREGALEVLARRGQIAFDLTETTTAAQLPWWQREVFGSGHLGATHLATFTRELASLIKAEIPIDEALRIVAVQPMLPARLRQITSRCLDRVLQGAALSEALAAQRTAFPEYYHRLVKAGEASGALGDVLIDLAKVTERASETRARVGSALVYPAVLLLAALIAIAVIVSVLVPAILPIFEDAGTQPPALISTSCIAGADSRQQLDGNCSGRRGDHSRTGRIGAVCSCAADARSHSTARAVDRKR